MITVLLLYKYVKFHVFNLLETEISVLWIHFRATFKLNICIVDTF